MKKIVLAIENNYIKETYAEVFRREGFEVFLAADGNEALEIINREKPEVVVADVLLPEKNGFDLLKEIRNNEDLKKTKVVIFSQFEKPEERQKAIEFEANDFITEADVPPSEAVRRIMIVLGEQKTYRIAIEKRLYDAKTLITDFGFTYDLKCKKCGADLVLFLMRDLSKGKDYFKVSFICPECGY